MEAKELRIGNIVCNKSAENTESVVCGISNQGMIRFDYNIRSWYELRDIEPISLTEEWLLKFGFENIGVNFQYNGISIWFSSYSKCFQLRYCLIGSYFERKINIEHVHQLQNLYFTLTGKELEYEK